MLKSGDLRQFGATAPMIRPGFSHPEAEFPEFGHTDTMTMNVLQGTHAQWTVRCGAHVYIHYISLHVDAKYSININRYRMI